MLKNYLKIAWRNLLRYKGISLINILGLSIGITCCVLVSLFIIDERSYDKYHADAGRIYRVVKDFVNDDGSKLPDATTPPAIAPALQKDIPEIETVVRLFPGWGSKFYVRNGEKDSSRKICTGQTAAYLMFLHFNSCRVILNRH